MIVFTPNLSTSAPPFPHYIKNVHLKSFISWQNFYQASAFPSLSSPHGNPCKKNLQYDFHISEALTQKGLYKTNEIISINCTQYIICFPLYIALYCLIFNNVIWGGKLKIKDKLLSSFSITVVAIETTPFRELHSVISCGLRQLHWLLKWMTDFCHAGTITWSIYVSSHEALEMDYNFFTNIFSTEKERLEVNFKHQKGHTC